MLQRKELSLSYMEQAPEKLENAPLVLMLHGYGSNEKDLIQIAPALPPEFRYISPRAPQVMDYGMYGWFPLEFTQNGIIVDHAAAERALYQLIGFVKELIDEYRPAGEKVFLMGFSQGTVMSYLTAFNAPELLHGVIALSGQLPEKNMPTEKALLLLRKIPFLLMHGLFDEVLPIAKGRAANAWLEQNIDKLIYREYPVAHQISDSGIELIRSWLEGHRD
ncbi:phospholipase [Chlorobium sp. BLA1]|uniref:alpha/beta hydrolase n=1 Tax=Candidatus Chlorobium masyuteum TaxID=2716876 RepID=UPI001422D00C|nr:phospholipase [Candidatus Chlorobium masyuteum]NHQ59982.1 phospholipase [Candidatus Chlorobium masyuteum]